MVATLPTSKRPIGTIAPKSPALRSLAISKPARRVRAISTFRGLAYRKRDCDRREQPGNHREQHRRANPEDVHESNREQRTGDSTEVVACSFQPERPPRGRR